MCLLLPPDAPSAGQAVRAIPTEDVTVQVAAAPLRDADREAVVLVPVPREAPDVTAWREPPAQPASMRLSYELYRRLSMLTLAGALPAGSSADGTGAWALVLELRLGTGRTVRYASNEGPMGPGDAARVFFGSPSMGIALGLEPRVRAR